MSSQSQHRPAVAKATVGESMRLKKAAAAASLSGVMAVGGLAVAAPAGASTARMTHVAVSQTPVAPAAHWAHYGWYSDEQTCWDTGFQIMISTPDVVNYNCIYVDYKFKWDLELQYALP